MNQIYSTEQIAKVCHDAQKSFCEAIGDTSQVAWEQAPEWQKEIAKSVVVFCMDNPFSAYPNHDKLPIEQQKKDLLFKAIVTALCN